MANHQNWQDIMDNLVKDRTRLKVYRGKQNAINHLEPEDGAIYFATDTKKSSQELKLLMLQEHLQSVF